MGAKGVVETGDGPCPAGVGQVDLQPVGETKALAGLDRHQFELALERTAGHSKQIAEDRGEGQSGFTCVEPVAVASVCPQCATDGRRLIQNRDVVAEVREARGRGQPRNTGSDDGDPSHDGGA